MVFDLDISIEPLNFLRSPAKSEKAEGFQNAAEKQKIFSKTGKSGRCSDKAEELEGLHLKGRPFEAPCDFHTSIVWYEKLTVLGVKVNPLHKACLR